MLASIEHNNSLIRRVRVDIGFRSRRRDLFGRTKVRSVNPSDKFYMFLREKKDSLVVKRANLSISIAQRGGAKKLVEFLGNCLLRVRANEV